MPAQTQALKIITNNLQIRVRKENPMKDKTPIVLEGIRQIITREETKDHISRTGQDMTVKEAIIKDTAVKVIKDHRAVITVIEAMTDPAARDRMTETTEAITDLNRADIKDHKAVIKDRRAATIVLNRVVIRDLKVTIKDRRADITGLSKADITDRNRIEDLWAATDLNVRQNSFS